MNRYNSPFGRRAQSYLLGISAIALAVGLLVNWHSSLSFVAGVVFCALSCAVFWRIGGVMQPGTTAGTAFGRLIAAFVLKFAVFAGCLSAALLLNLSPIWLLAGIGLALAFFVFELLHKN